MSTDSFVISKILQKHGYTIEKTIGRGGQGVCMLVFSEKYKTHFACKCMHLDFINEEAAKQQFEREVYSLSHIIHKNIVQIFDHFCEGMYMFMIIEYCQNGSLMTALKKKNRNSAIKDQFNFDYIRKIFIDILSALKYCHEEIHITHHDIKPGNIVIDTFGRAKLCDFGMSSYMEKHIDNKANEIEDPNSTKEKQQIGGSLYFMSPQLLQASLTPNYRFDTFSADIWAFGITAFYILTNTYPFVGRTKSDLLKIQNLTLNPNQQAGQSSTLFDLLPGETPDDIRMVIEKSLIYNEVERAKAGELLLILTHKPGQNISLRESNYRKAAETNTVLNPAHLLATPSIKINKPSIRQMNARSTIATQSLLQVKEKSLIMKPRVSSMKL